MNALGLLLRTGTWRFLGKTVSLRSIEGLSLRITCRSLARPSLTKSAGHTHVRISGANIRSKNRGDFLHSPVDDLECTFQQKLRGATVNPRVCGKGISLRCKQGPFPPSTARSQRHYSTLQADTFSIVESSFRKCARNAIYRILTVSLSRALRAFWG